MLDAGEVIEAIRMAGEDEDLQLPRRWCPSWVAFSGDANNVEHAPVLCGIRMGEWIIQDRNHRPIPSEHSAQGEAAQKAQLLAGSVGFFFQVDRFIQMTNHETVGQI